MEPAAHLSGILQSEIIQSGILQVSSCRFWSPQQNHLGSYSLGSYRSQTADCTRSAFIWDPDLKSGILQSGILQFGVLKSGILQKFQATEFGARSALIWDATVRDPTVRDPTDMLLRIGARGALIWDPTGLKLPSLEPPAHSSGMLQSGILQSGIPQVSS